MYIPTFNQQDDQEELLRFMQQHNFISLVTQYQDQLMASHIPVMLKETADALVISGHLARANPQAQAFGKTQALAIFTGPHAYISPTLYEKAESVPTWNYIAVHAYGLPQGFSHKEKPEAIEAMLRELIAAHEASYEGQWQGLSKKYRQGMMQGIVGFEMKVDKLEGKYKLSQNRTLQEQKNVARALAAHTDSTVAETGEMMLKGLELKT